MEWDNATRRDLIVHIAKQAAKEGRYGDVVDGIKNLVLMYPEPLTYREAKLLEKGFSNVIASARSFRRNMALIVQNEESIGIHGNVESIKGYIRDLEKRIEKDCSDFKFHIGEFVITKPPNNKDKKDCLALYNMMVGDSLRYRAEQKRDDGERKELAEQALLAYEAATKVVDDEGKDAYWVDLRIILKVALNFSVLCYEFLDLLERGHAIAKKYVDKVQPKLEGAEIKQYLKCIQIMEIINANSFKAEVNAARKARDEEVLQLKDTLDII